MPAPALNRVEDTLRATTLILERLETHPQWPRVTLDHAIRAEYDAVHAAIRAEYATTPQPERDTLRLGRAAVLHARALRLEMQLAVRAARAFMTAG